MSYEFYIFKRTAVTGRNQTELSAFRQAESVKKERDAAISAIITGADSRFLVIIGPCSADNEDSVCDYVSRLTSIQEDVADKLILIPRVYTNKPRTTGEGYKGIASQPDPEKRRT